MVIKLLENHLLKKTGISAFFFLFSLTLVSKLGAVNLKIICKHTEYSILIFFKEKWYFFLRVPKWTTFVCFMLVCKIILGRRGF